jgi:hypothetical protein
VEKAFLKRRELGWSFIPVEVVGCGIHRNIDEEVHDHDITVTVVV